MALTNDPKLREEIDRWADQRREAQRLAPQAVDLSAPRQPEPPSREQLAEAEKMARAFLRSIRRRRAAGRVRFGETYAIPKGKRRRD